MVYENNTQIFFIYKNLDLVERSDPWNFVSATGSHV